MWRVKYDPNPPDIKCRWLCGILPVGSFFFLSLRGKLVNKEYPVYCEPWKNSWEQRKTIVWAKV